MNILSLHLINHDANVTYYSDETVVNGKKSTYLNIERVKGIKKYHYYKWDFPKLADDLKGMGIPKVLDAIVVTVGEQTGTPEEEEKLNWRYKENDLIHEISEEKFLNVFENIPYRAEKYYRCEHHYAHYMNGVWLHGINSGLVIDGCGDYGVHTSVFKGRKRVLKYAMQDMCSIGDLYYDISADLLGRGIKEKWENTFADRSGNFMGLISYGKVNETYANHLRKYDFKEFVGEAFNHFKYFSVSGMTEDKVYFGHGHKAITEDGRGSTKESIYPHAQVHVHPNGYPFVNQWHLDWFRTVQTVLAEKLVQFCAEYFKHDEEFVYSGGVAHNVVINEVLSAMFTNMKIPPSIGDEGQSIGSMYAILDHLGIEADDCPTTNWQDEVIPMMDKETAYTVADLMIHDKIIAVCQGESHVGPRALGNRSILYLTNRKYAAHYFNERKIKEREWWRPYGIMILEEDLSKYLQTETLSPYMLHTAKPTELGTEALSGVIHTDNTVRYQTISDGPYRWLLERLKEMGLPPTVINTSLNAPGKPMCHTVGDTMSFADNYGPDVVVIGNEVFLTNHRGVLWSNN
jgi:carbamoyltransferase